MENAKILDCTLRDGGYVNNWNFGKEAIDDIISLLYKAKIDIIELGFIRDEACNPDRTVFCSMRDMEKRVNSIARRIGKRPKFAAMAEIEHPIPLNMIEPADCNHIDIIRVIVWKNRRDKSGKMVDALQSSYEYCKGIVEKGYQLYVQPNRTDQYSEEEFENMVRMFSDLSPAAIYVVDSWGTMYSDQVLRYMDLADAILPKHISLGFHGHNNMMQAFGTAEQILKRSYSREIIIDASVFGIGRGAGNLNLELITRYFNVMYAGKYNLMPIIEIYDCYIEALRSKYDWGSDMPFFVSSDANANPNYASFFKKELSILEMREIFQEMPQQDRVIYSNRLAEEYQKKVLGR